MNHDHFQSFLSLEQQQLDLCLETGLGYHLLVLGELNARRVVVSPIHDHFAVVSPVMERGGDAVADWQQLPFAANSVDAVVLLHGLERAENASAVLAEAQRVLHPAGRLLVVGFNPLRIATQSWAKTLLGESRVQHLYSGFELKTLLARVGFTIDSYHPYGYRSHPQVNINSWSERLGRRFLPGLSLGYTIVARKNMRCVTPVKPSWASHPLPLRVPVASPGLNREGATHCSSEIQNRENR